MLLNGTLLAAKLKLGGICRLEWFLGVSLMGRFKLNADGSRSSNGLIGAGGVIRNATGD